MTTPQPAAPFLPKFLVIGGWFALVIGAAVSSVPILGLVSVPLVPAGALALTIAAAWPAAPTASRTHRWLGGLISGAGTLFLAGVTAEVVLQGAWTILAWQRSTVPSEGVGFWVLMIGLNVLGAAVTEAGYRLRLGAGATGLVERLVWLAPVAAFLSMMLVSRFLPLGA